MIDDWGSLYQKNVTYGTGESYLQTVNNNMNRFDGPGYDAAGNLLSSGSFYNIFNSENQWTYVSATNSSYLYDGDGNKVQTSGGASGTTIFWRDQKGQVLSETDQTGSVNNNYIYLNRQAVAWIDIGHGVPTAYRYYIHDHLGTTRVMTTSTGSVCYDADFFPWGGEQHLFTNTCSQNYKFTGKERDPDTNSTDYFGARWYQGAMARFYSPDWSDDPEPVPYARLDNPQSLNLYTYAQDNPTTLRDEDGHDLGDAEPDVAITSDSTGDSSSNAQQKSPPPVVPGVSITVTASVLPVAEELISYEMMEGPPGWVIAGGTVTFDCIVNAVLAAGRQLSEGEQYSSRCDRSQRGEGTGKARREGRIQGSQKGAKMG